MQAKIDQSSKIEYTSKNTVIAYANHKQKSLLIKAKEKRKIEKIFRQAGKPYIFIYKTFAILIYLLIKDDLDQISQIIIDTEYHGHEPLIKDFLLQIIRGKKGKLIDPDAICFRQIGRKSEAHKKAINTYKGKLDPDMVVASQDVLPYIL